MKYTLRWFSNKFFPALDDKLKGSSLELATQDDASFVFTQVIESSKNGHFNPILQMPEAQMGLRLQIGDSIEEGRCYVNPIEIRNSRILIKRVNGVPVGFSWITYGEDNQYEIYLLAVVDQYRKKGYGTEILLESIKNIPHGSTIYGRLYHVSKIMREIMNKNGFKEVKTKARDTVRLELVKN
ncbi:hypothetical protein VCSRO184_0843 [Vibrio cholerae]|nr:GNAT family N-acetyltransferase [Vibrio cholerae]GIB00817.1 hypothetical protein VCSRO184_0843 [Vibrio cholerae]